MTIPKKSQVLNPCWWLGEKSDPFIRSIYYLFVVDLLKKKTQVASMVLKAASV